MRSRSSAPLHIKVIVLGVLALSGIATAHHSFDEALARRTVPGTEVMVRGFAEVDADCKLKHVQTIRVVAAPIHGRIDQRPGVVTIGADGVGDRTCRGTRLDGVQVFYVPDGTYVGRDRFAFDAEDLGHRVVHAKVDVTVGLEGRSASN